jgi:hypothetical protein
VLRAAVANVFGNKSLFNSNYKAFKTVKLKEREGTALIINKMIKNYKGDKKKIQVAVANSCSNPLKKYLNMKLYFKIWKRYMMMYEACEKDSVDIDSDDFVLEELQLNEVEAEMVAKSRGRTNQNSFAFGSGAKSPFMSGLLTLSLMKQKSMEKRKRRKAIGNGVPDRSHTLAGGFNSGLLRTGSIRKINTMVNSIPPRAETPAFYSPILEVPSEHKQSFASPQIPLIKLETIRENDLYQSPQTKSPSSKHREPKQVNSEPARLRGSPPNPLHKAAPLDAADFTPGRPPTPPLKPSRLRDLFQGAITVPRREDAMATVQERRLQHSPTFTEESIGEG